MSTPANELFTVLPADPLGGIQKPATTTPAPDDTNINPLKFIGDGLFNSGVDNTAAMQDTGKFIQGAYLEREARKNVDPLDGVQKLQYNSQFGKDPATQNMGRLIDRMENNLLKNKYDYYMGQGMKFGDAQKRAEYEAKLEVDQLMSDKAFRSDLQGYYSGLSAPEPGQEQPGQEQPGQQNLPQLPGEKVDLSKTALGALSAADQFAAKAVGSGVAYTLGVDQEVVDKAIAQGGLGLMQDIINIQNKDVGTLVTEGLRNLGGGIYKNLVYDLPGSLYGISQMYNELTGDDGRAAEWSQMADQAQKDGQAFFQRNNIDPEAVLTGMGNVIPMFVGPLGLGRGAVGLANMFRATAMAPKSAGLMQALIATVPMVPYSIGLTYPEARKGGATKEDAAYYSLTMGATEGLAEFFPFARIGKMFNMPPAVSKFFASPRAKIWAQRAKKGDKVALAKVRQATRDFLAQGTTELTEETISTIVDMYAQVKILGKEEEEVLREALAPYMNQTVPVSVLFGGIVGAAGGASSISSLRRKLALLHKNSDPKASVNSRNAADSFKGVGSEQPADGIDPETGLPVEESLNTGPPEPDPGLNPETPGPVGNTAPVDSGGGGAPAGGGEQPAASFESNLAGGETAPVGTGPDGQEQVVQTEATDEEGKIAWGDLGVNAAEGADIEALANEMGISNNDIERVFAGRPALLNAMTPEMRKNMAVSTAANNVLFQAIDKLVLNDPLFGGDKQRTQDLADKFLFSGDALIAAAVASGDTEIIKDIQSASKAYNRDGNKGPVVQIIKRLDKILNDRDNATLKDAIIGQVYDEWQKEIVDSEGLLGDPEALASFNLGGRAQAVAKAAGTIVNTPAAKAAAEAAGTAGTAAKDAASAVVDKARAAGATAQKSGARVADTAKAIVDSLVADVREAVPPLRPEQQTPVRDDAGLGINKSAADAVAESLNIQSVTTFDQLQAYVASDLDAGSADKILAGQVVKAIVNGDAFELVSTKFNLSEDVAAVDVAQAIEELRLIDPKTAVPIETTIGRIARSKPEGLTQDSEFAREVVARAEKSSKARKRSERTGAAPEVLSVNEEIKSDIYLKTGIFSDEVTSDLSSILIDDFLKSGPMEAFGIASEIELNRALTGVEGVAIRNLLDAYVSENLNSLSPRDVRQRLIEIAQEKDGEDSTAIADAIREEGKAFDALGKAIKERTGESVPNDVIAAKIIEFTATSREDTPRFKTSFVRMLNKLLGGSSDKSRANRMYFGETIGLMQGLAPRRSLGRVFREIMSGKGRFTTQAGVTQSLFAKSLPKDSFVEYVARQMENYMERHPQQDIDSQASYMARLMHELAFPTRESTDIDGNIFEPKQYAADMGKKVFSANNPAANVDAKASTVYWSNLDLGLTDEDIFGPVDTEIPIQYQESIRYLLSDLGSPRGADVPFMKVESAAQRKEAANNIRNIIRSALQRRHMSLLREMAVGDSREKSDAIDKTLEVLGINANHREKVNIQQLETYTGTPSYRVAQKLVNYFFSATQPKEGIEDVPAEQKLRTVPEEALLEETYRAAAPGSRYEGGSVLATFKTMLHRFNILPEASVSYEALKTQPEIVRSIFNQAVFDLIQDPSDLYDQSPEFLAMFEDVYQVEIRVSDNEDGIEFVPRASVMGRDENITSIIERAKQLLKLRPRMKARMHDEGVKADTVAFLEKAYKRSPMMTPGIRALIDNETAFGDMHQSTIDSILRFASSNAAKQQEAILSEILQDETKRRIVHGHLNKLFMPTGERGGTAEEREASKAFLRNIVSIGSDVGSAVQVSDLIKNVPMLRRKAKSESESLKKDIKLALLFGRAGGSEDEKAAERSNKSAGFINESVDNARLAWAEVLGMSQSMSGLLPAGTNPEDVTPEMISENLRVPVTYARAAMRDSSENTIAYLLSVQTEGKGMDVFATDIKAGHSGALGVLDMLTLGRLESKTGVRMTPGNAELLGRIYNRMGTYKGPSQLLSMFTERGAADVAADLQQATNIEVNNQLKAMRAKMESAEAQSYALPDFDTSASAALRNVEEFIEVLPNIDPNNMQDFLDNPDSYFTPTMNKEARDAIQYAARTTARGKELMETLSVLTGMYRVDPNSMDPSVLVNMYAATANFFNSEERTKLFNWMGWAYTREGSQSILNKRYMPDNDVLLEKPDALLQSADLVGTRLGVNMHALNTILTARTSVFGEAATKVVTVKGKKMTVHEIMDEMSGLFHDIRGIDTLKKLGLAPDIKNDLGDKKIKKLIDQAQKKLKNIPGYTSKKNSGAMNMLLRLEDLKKVLEKPGRMQRALSRRAELAAALENDLTTTRDEIKGYVSSLVDLGWNNSLSGQAFHSKVADMASMLWESGRGDAAIAVLDAMPTNDANESLKLRMSAGIRLMDMSSPESKAAILASTSWSVEEKMGRVVSNMQRDINDLSLTSQASDAVDNRLGKLSPRAMDPRSAARTIAPLLARHGIFLTSGPGEKLVDSSGRPIAGGLVNVGKRSSTTWPKADAQAAWMAIWEMHLRAGLIDGKGMRRIGESLGIPYPEYIDMILTAQPNNSVGTSPEAVVGMASKFFSVELTAQEKRIIASGGQLSIKREKDRENMSRFIALSQASNDVVQMLARDSQGSLTMQMLDAWINPYLVDPGNGNPMVGTEGFAVILDMLEWKYKKKTGKSPNMKLAYGDGLSDFASITTTDGKTKRPGLEQLNKLMRTVEGDPKRVARLRSLQDKEAAREAKGYKPLTNPDALHRQIQAAGGISSLKGDGRILVMQLKERILSVLYDLHAQSGDAFIGESLSEVMNDYALSLLTKQDVSTLGKEYENHQRSITRNLKALTSFMASVKDVYEQASARSPARSRKGLQKDLRSLEKTQELGKALGPAINYRALWAEARHNGPPGGGLRRVKTPDGDIINEVVLSGAWTLPELASVLDEISGNTGKLVAEAVSVTEDFMLPPSIILGAYDIEGDRIKAIKLDMSDPKIKQQLNALSRVSKGQKITKGSTGQLSLDTLMDIASRLGPESEAVYKKEAVDSDTLTKGAKKYEALPSGNFTGTNPVITTEEGDVDNLPSAGAIWTYKGPQGTKSLSIASSVSLPKDSSRPGDNSAAAALFNVEATGIGDIATALDNMTNGMSPDVIQAWRETIAYLDDSKDYNTSLQALDKLATITNDAQGDNVNQKYQGYVYKLSNLVIARTLNLAANTKTPISDIESNLAALFNTAYNRDVDSKYNFMAQFLEPAGLDVVYSELLGTSSVVEDTIWALRDPNGGTEQERRATAAGILSDYTDNSLGLVEAFNNSNKNAAVQGGIPQTPGKITSPFNGGAAPAPQETGGDNFMASMASIRAPDRPRENGAAAIARVVTEINRSQPGVVDDLRRLGILEVVYDFEALPPEVKTAMVNAYGQEAITSTQAIADNKTGRVWMVSKNLPNGAAWPVLLHEMGVHIGLEGMIGREKITGLARSIEIRAKNGDLTAKKAMNRFKQAAEANPALQDRRNPTANEEIIAYFVEGYAGAENPENSGIISKLIGMVRRWAFKKFGASADILTSSDILQLAYSSLRKAPSAIQAKAVTDKALETALETRGETSSPSFNASNTPPGKHNGRLDTGDGVVIDTRSPAEKEKSTKYYNDRAKARDKGATMEEANKEASSGNDSPFEANKKISRQFAEDTGQKMLSFVTRWVDGMAPARNAMRRAGQAVGEKYIPEEFNFYMDTVLGVDKHAEAENFLQNSILPQFGEVISDLKISLQGVEPSDGRKWNDEKIRELINYWAEAKAAKEHNHAYLMFHAPYSTGASSQRKQVLTDWKSGAINSSEARKRVSSIFEAHKKGVPNYEAWYNEWKGAGSGNDPETLAGILKANAGAYAAGKAEFEKVSDIMRQVMEKGIEYLDDAGHTDPKLFDLYGFKHYMPMHAKRRGTKGNAIADILTGSGPMVTPTAWGNKNAMIMPSKATGGMNGDGVDRLLLFLMNSSEIKAENAPAKKMRDYARKYKGTEAEKYLRVVERQTDDYIKVTDQGTLARTSIGEMVSEGLDENMFILHENGKLTVLEVDSNALDGDATAAAIKGNWRVTHPGQEIYSDAVNKTIIGTGRFIASAFTRFNPYFSVKAMFRDSQTYGVTILNEFGADVAASFSGEFATMLATRLGVGTLATLTKEIDRVDKGGQPLTDLGRDYETLMRAGALTTRARLQTQVGRTLAFEDASSTPSRNPLKGLANLLTNFSQAGEMVGRISAYRAFLTHGMSETEAAFQTKRLMDFSQRGAALPTSSILTVWSLFLRPNLTGASRIIESFDNMVKDSPARAAAVTSVLIGMGTFMAMLTYALVADDEEDEEKWRNQSPEKMMFGLRIPGSTFGDTNDIEIPFGYGVGFFLGIGALLYKSNVTGNYDDFNLNLMAKAASRHFTPFEWTGDLVKSVANVAMPDMVEPFYELANNKNQWGYDLYKTRKSVPDYLDAKSSTPQIWIDVADIFNNVGESMGLEQSLSFSPDGYRAIAGLMPGVRKTMDIASLGREGDGIDMLITGMGQLVGVAGTNRDYAADAYKDLQKVATDAEEYIAYVSYTGHGASAEEITAKSSGLRIQAIVKSADKQLRKLYKERQAVSDSYVAAGQLKDKDLIAGYDREILKIKMGAVRMGLDLKSQGL